jgi:hypothetical protein
MYKIQANWERKGKMAYELSKISPTMRVVVILNVDGSNTMDGNSS